MNLYMIINAILNNMNILINFSYFTLLFIAIIAATLGILHSKYSEKNTSFLVMI